MAHKETSKEILGLTRITKKHIQKLCKKDKLYQTPELNDVLYLHYQGFDCIECLDDYTELKCLWLECNAISEIKGLNKQTKLKCLFLQSNLIRKIENLEYCKELDTLNLSQNHIRKIENCGFEVLPVLNTLNLASNYLKDSESLKALVNCKNLSVLDLSNNRIDDILAVKIFSQMPELKVLVLQGNPVVSKIPQYRKTLILECSKLTYLDSRPVFPKDRACAEAWKRGGYAEERKENELWNRKERKKIRDSVNATINLRNKHRKLEEKISCIPSSDSEEEDEEKLQKKNTKIHLDSGVSVYNTWDKVTDYQNSTTISNHGNQDQNCNSFPTSASGKEETEIMDTTILNMDYIETMKQHQIGEHYGVLEISQSDSKVQKDLNEQEERYLPQANLATFEKVTRHEQYEAEDKIPKDDNQFAELKRDSRQNNVVEIEHLNLFKHSGPDQDAHKIYASAIESIEQIRVPLDSAETKLEISVEECDSKEKKCYDNCEILKESEEMMSVFLQEESSQRKLENARESLKVHNRLTADFEELSTNVSNFLKDLGKEPEKQQGIQNALFCDEKTAKHYSAHSADIKGSSIDLKSKIDCLNDRWDNQSKMKNTGTNSRMNEDFSDSLLNYPGKVTTSARTNNYKGHQLDPSSNGKENVVNLQYVSMDISSLTRKSNAALESLETESKLLKILLKKLENRHDNIFKERNLEDKNEKEAESFRNLEHDDICKQNMEEDIPQSNSDFCCLQSKKTAEDLVKGSPNEVEQVVETILKEILQSLDNVSTRTSYELPYDFTEYKGDLNIISNFTQPEKANKTIPEVIQSFNQLFNRIEDKQRTNEKCSLENPDIRKSLCLKELSQKANLKQFNNDTLLSLNAQLEEIRKNQHKKVRRLIDHVYGQKDLYNDTLELVDNKLMVRNQITKELHELSKPLHTETSDSEDGYDTALSEADETIEQKFKSFSPKSHKSSEDLIFNSFKENDLTISNDESEESMRDEFYSLDAQDKPSLYNIDKELFKNLTFDLSSLSQQDENHIAQCARSYEELKYCLTRNKEERQLSEPEKELLENLDKRKCNRSQAETLLKFDKTLLGRYQQQPSQLEKSFENSVTKSYLRDVLISQKSKEPHQSEEEKNEIENNTDMENEAAYKKIFDCKANCGVSNDESKKINEKKNEQTSEQSTNTEIIECSLEILSDNDELTDTITVNAELHF